MGEVTEKKRKVNTFLWATCRKGFFFFFIKKLAGDNTFQSQENELKYKLKLSTSLYFISSDLAIKSASSGKKPEPKRLRNDQLRDVRLGAEERSRGGEDWVW